MRGFLGLTKRNLMIYFKDFSAVFFSLLSSIIVFVLYLVFLKGNYVDALNAQMQGLETFIHSEDIDSLVSLILMSGIIGSAMITIPYSCLSTIIKDKEQKIDFDISATPVRRPQIILSYYISAVISSFIVTSVILTAGLLILNANGNIYMSFAEVAKAYGLVLLGSISSAALFLIIAMFFKSSSASSAFFGILSAISGFIIGAYIPLAEFSESVQTVCNLFPATQITVLVKNTLMSGILDKINGDIAGVDSGAFISAIKRGFSFESKLFGNVLSDPAMLLYIGCFLIVTIVIMIFTYSATYKRK